MVRKVSITLHDDGMATVESDINYVYPTYERGLEVLQLIVLSLSEKPVPGVAVPLTPEIEERISRIIKRHNTVPQSPGYHSDCIYCNDELKSEPVKKASAKKKRGGNNNKANKYGIPPTLFHTDKRAYQRLWSRCKKGGIMYEEALKLEGKTNRGRKTSTAAKNAPPQTEIHRGEPPSDIKTIASPLGLVEPGYSAPAIKLGDHIKQIKKFQDRQVSGVGVVTNFVKGLIEVNFNGTQYYTIAPDCLELV